MYCTFHEMGRTGSDVAVGPRTGLLVQRIHHTFEARHLNDMQLTHWRVPTPMLLDLGDGQRVSRCYDHGLFVMLRVRTRFRSQLSEQLSGGEGELLLVCGMRSHCPSCRAPSRDHIRLRHYAK